MSLTVKPSRVAVERPLLWVPLGTFLVLVTYVNPMATIPRTAADLGAGPVARAWILSSMSVGLAGALLASGVLGDTFGRRRAYVGGLAALGLGAAVCAASPDPALFVAGRVLQGVGGAAVLSCGLAALAHAHAPGPARVHATSVWGASLGLGIAGGSVLAALLDVGSGWRECYALTAVVAVALLVPSWRGIGESSAVHPRRVDLAGLVLLVAGMSLLVSALTQGRDGVDAASVVLGVLALVCLGAFWAVERRVAEPLLEPGLLGNRRFRAATTGSLFVGLGMIGLASYVPTMAQVAMGAGLWIAAGLVAAWAGTSVVTAMLLTRVRHPLEGPYPIAALLVVVAVGQLLGYGLSEGSGPGRLVAPLVVAGLATGFLNALPGREAVASVAPDRAAMASGANNTARYLGAALGITLFVTVATHTGGGDLVAGWNLAVLVSATTTLLGAALIALAGLRRPAV